MIPRENSMVIEGNCLDVLKTIPEKSVDCCVTSPPYFGLRDYDDANQIGLETTPEAFVETLVAVFQEVRRVLKDDGTLWLNLGDSYNAAGRKGYGSRQGVKQGTNRASAKGVDYVRPNVDGLKQKDLIGIPWRVAFALQADGWYLRQDIIWAKPNPMPEPVKDRCTKSHEYVFLLSKSKKYYFDADAIKEPSIYAPGKTHEVERAPGYYAGKHSHRNASGRNDLSFKAIREFRNKRDVWVIPPAPYKGAHFATFPPALVEPCILAGSRKGGIVLDPFGGAGTTGVVASRLLRKSMIIELNPSYARIARERIRADEKSRRDA
jgi:DNA modification methylase